MSFASSILSWPEARATLLSTRKLRQLAGDRFWHWSLPVSSPVSSCCCTEGGLPADKSKGACLPAQLEVEFESLAELEQFWAAIPPELHRAWSQRAQAGLCRQLFD